MSVDEVDRDLNHLSYSMRCAAVELIARCAERKVWLIVLETRRSPERLAHLIAAGASHSERSFHLPGPVDGLSDAMDAAPIKRVDDHILKIIEWAKGHESWEVYGDEALRLGLEWGGTWEWEDFSHVQRPRR